MRTINQRQGLGPDHIVHPQNPVEVRKELVPARDLPLQIIAKRVGLDRKQHEVVFTSKMLGRRFGRLRGGGEMQEALVSMLRRAFKVPTPVQLRAVGKS